MCAAEQRPPHTHSVTAAVLGLKRVWQLPYQKWNLLLFQAIIHTVALTPFTPDWTPNLLSPVLLTSPDSSPNPPTHSTVLPSLLSLWYFYFVSHSFFHSLFLLFVCSSYSHSWTFLSFLSVFLLIALLFAVLVSHSVLSISRFFLLTLFSCIFYFLLLFLLFSFVILVWLIYLFFVCNFFVPFFFFCISFIFPF